MALHIVLRVRLPDRPGALGSVASRIGAVGANITDVTIARRADDETALDEFHLTLSESREVDVVEVLRAELGEVDGVHVEGWFTSDRCCLA